MVNQDYEKLGLGQYPCIVKYEEAFGVIPSMYFNKGDYDSKVLEAFKEFPVIFRCIRGDVECSVCTISNNVWMEVRSYLDDEIVNFTLYCPVEYDGQVFEDTLKSYIKKKKRRTQKFSNVNIIGNEGRGLVMENFEFKAPKINLSLNYGEAFVEKSRVMIQALNKKNNKGIILLHSIPGTGKSSYIKHLLAVLKKTVIYIPPSMINSIAEPSFISFIRDYENSVLILEDAEKVLKSREAGNQSQAAISNLLNLSDGILADCLNIQIVATFNTTKEQIDPALLRKGRLIMRHEFKPLEIAEAQRLANHLKLDIKVTKPMTLADIYNANDFDSNEEIEVKKIGFGV
jgi:SpoVK/Ycf46/Vps4 family AAA+-type ATPase